MFKLLPFEYAMRNLARSPLRLALTTLGSAVVVMLVLAAGAFVRGMESSLVGSGQASNVILLGAGSEESTERSEISPATAGIIAASISGVKTTLDQPHISPQVHISLSVSAAADSGGEPVNVFIRGVTPAALLVHDRVQIIDGRLPAPGAEELLVGRLVAARMGLAESDLQPGRQLWIDHRPWTIVGVFAAPQSVMESEIWTALSDLKTATKRDTDSCIVLTLQGAEFADVQFFAQRRMDLELTAMRETDYYAALSSFFGPIRALAWGTAALIAVGGLFGGLNTLYAAFAARIRELGTLQCLGYSRLAILISLVQESLIMSAAGALIGCGAAMLALDGLAVSFSMGAFPLRTDPLVLALGLAAGLALGVIGAIPPAIRSLRPTIPIALKSA